LQFSLVEVRRRRANFLNEVRRTLRLPNVEVLEQRAESPPHVCEHKAAAVLSRAVWSDEELLTIAARWLVPGGALVWMRSNPLPSDVVTRGYDREKPLQYRIEANRPRYIEILHREADSRST
jgi:16S rRNA G527 N7-methylase RsmG